MTIVCMTTIKTQWKLNQEGVREPMGRNGGAAKKLSRVISIVKGICIVVVQERMWRRSAIKIYENDDESNYIFFYTVPTNSLIDT